MNPYWGSSFFSFFFLLIKRIFTGEISHLEADEVQIIVLSLVSFSCGLISPFLVLKKMTMFANALSHTILLGIIVSFLLTSHFWGRALFDPVTLLLGAMSAAIMTAILTEGVAKLFKLNAEACIGFIFSSLFALGVIGASVFTKNIHLSAEAVMGNPDALQVGDISFVFYLALFHLAIVPLFFRKWQMVSFDPSFGASLGIKPSVFHFLLLMLTSLVCVAGFRAVGVLLILSFLTGPYLIARLFSNRLSTLLVLTPSIGVVVSFVGVALSRHFLSYYDLPLSTGGIVVTLIAVCYVACLGIKRVYSAKIPQTV